MLWKLNTRMYNVWDESVHTCILEIYVTGGLAYWIDLK